MTRRDQVSFDADHQLHDRFLIARSVADDIDSHETALVERLLSQCSDCAALARDLRSISLATSALPAPRRPRDFRLTEEQAAAVHGSLWQRLMRRFAAPGSAVLQPLAGAAVAIGLVLVVVGTTLPAQPGVPVSAPAADDGASFMQRESAATDGSAPLETGAGAEATAAAGQGAPMPSPPEPRAAVESAAAPSLPSEFSTNTQPPDQQPAPSGQDLEPSRVSPGDESAAPGSEPGPTATDPTTAVAAPGTGSGTGEEPDAPAIIETAGGSSLGQVMVLLGALLAGVGILLVALRMIASRTRENRPDR